MKLAQAGNFAKVDVTNLDLMANFNLEVPKQEEPKQELPKQEEQKLPSIEAGKEENNFYKDTFAKLQDQAFSAGLEGTILALGKVTDPSKTGSYTISCFHSIAVKCKTFLNYRFLFEVRSIREKNFNVGMGQMDRISSIGWKNRPYNKISFQQLPIYRKFEVSYPELCWLRFLINLKVCKKNLIKFYKILINFI